MNNIALAIAKNLVNLPKIDRDWMVANLEPGVFAALVMRVDGGEITQTELRHIIQSLREKKS